MTAVMQQTQKKQWFTIVTYDCSDNSMQWQRRVGFESYLLKRKQKSMQINGQYDTYNEFMLFEKINSQIMETVFDQSITET